MLQSQLPGKHFYKSFQGEQELFEKSGKVHGIDHENDRNSPPPCIRSTRQELWELQLDEL